MRYFIVHAHHEPKSFNGALTTAATERLRDEGHSVEVSDLYAMGFEPISDRRNFVTTADPDYLKQQAEESHASANDGFAPDIAAEIEKLERCDALVFQFPLWWFGMPAILKGWCDRVLAMGRVYGEGKWYENGIGAGKPALVSMTTGGPPPMYGPAGLNPPMDVVLAPVNHGVFWFNGFRPVEPFITWGPARMTEDARKRQLDRYAEYLLSIESAERLPTLPSAEFDAKAGFVDRLARFCVRWRLVGDPPGDELIEAELARVEELRASGVLLDHWVAKDRLSGGSTLRAADRAAAEAILAEFSMASLLEFDIAEINTEAQHILGA